MKTKKMHIGIGSLTMIMLFVVLCLTIFAVLSLITVDRDYKLTQKTVQSMVEFYAADARAQKRLARIDAHLMAAQEQVAHDPEQNYLVSVAKRLAELADVTWLTEAGEEVLRISYEEPLETKQILEVVLEVTSDGVEAGPRYRIIEWALKTNEAWEQELDQPVFEDITLE